MRYFRAATPIEEIGQLNLGSRPAARRRRARPAGPARDPLGVRVDAEPRRRCPAGTVSAAALAAWAGEDESRFATLAEMYREWPFFSTLVDNCQVSLRKGDMLIAEVYSGLAQADDRAAVFGAIREEYARSEAALCRLTGQRDLLDQQPWLQHSIRVRNPYIDPMNHVQVALLRRLRDQAPEAPEAATLREAVLLSVNGIAAGLRNTG